VILDVDTPALGGVTIDGKLSFAENADVELTTERIMLHGELAIGTEAKPHARKATITFTDNVKGENIMAGMGDRGIMISGGTLNLHGDRTHTWSKLSATANAGATSIQVLDARGWKVGDEIVLASTDFDPRQAERRTIAAIRGNTITLDKKLDYMTPCFLATSGTARSSALRRMVTICSSVNRVFFIGSLSGPRAPFSQASAGPKIAGGHAVADAGGAQYPRYGYRTIRIFLERQGRVWGTDRMYRPWREAWLQVPRKRPRRRVVASRPRPLPVAAVVPNPEPAAEGLNAHPLTVRQLP
jgi:hypothetical protein